MYHVRLRGNGSRQIPLDRTRQVPERSLLPASQRYRARAEECRHRAQSLRDPRIRNQMLRLAADYEIKAMQAEAFEIKESKNE
jgi:hypothetical protein